MRKTYAVRLRDETEQRAVAVEAPRAADIDDLKALLVMPVEDLLRDSAFWAAIHERECIGAMPRDAHDGYRYVRQYAPYGRVGPEVFERQCRRLNDFVESVGVECIFMEASR